MVIDDQNLHWVIVHRPESCVHLVDDIIYRVVIDLKSDDRPCRILTARHVSAP
jgi:hypothetical protein